MTYFFSHTQTDEIEALYSKVQTAETAEQAAKATNDLYVKLVNLRIANVSLMNLEEPEGDEPCHKDDDRFHEDREARLAQEGR